MRAVYPYVHILIKSMQSAALLHLWIAVYQNDSIVNILAKSLRRTIELKLLWVYIIMEKWITPNEYRTSCLVKNIIKLSKFVKRLFSKWNAWLIFCSVNATTVSEFSYRVFQCDKFLVNIQLQWKQTHITWHVPEEGLNSFHFAIT